MSAPVRSLGRVDYAPTLAAMRAFTESRGTDTADEIWLCEHLPVYTQGLAGKPEHVLQAHGIPVVLTDSQRRSKAGNLLTTLRKRGVDGWKIVADRRGAGAPRGRLVKGSV